MITSKVFGKTTTGETVTAFTLTNEKGAYVNIIDLGCTIVDIFVPDKAGKLTDVCLGYKTVAEYEQNGGYLGAVVGRYGNRIGQGKFTLNGKEYSLYKNDGNNHLHGGKKGFDKYIWGSKIDGDSLIFSRTSPDGEEGYPGNLEMQVIYTFTANGELGIEYIAKTDADTILNLTNHAYFNLSGEASGKILDQEMQIFADQFTEANGECLTTGVILDVEGTPFDFRDGKPIGRDIELDDVQLKNGGGFDHNWVLEKKQTMKRAALVVSPTTGIKMEVATTQPGMQFYAGNMLTGATGKSGTKYEPRTGFCLETQHFPNAMACPEFESPVLKKGEVYNEKTVYTFGIL